MPISTPPLVWLNAADVLAALPPLEERLRLAEIVLTADAALLAEVMSIIVPEVCRPSAVVSAAPIVPPTAPLAPSLDRKSTRLNSSHVALSRMPSSA